MTNQTKTAYEVTTERTQLINSLSISGKELEHQAFTGYIKIKGIA